MAVVLLFSVACDYAATTAPESAKASASVAGEAKSLEGVNFLRWSDKTWEKMTSLNKPGWQSKTITPNGGKVGGPSTFDNWVLFPPGAIDSNQTILVRATCLDNKNPCSAKIEFLPSQTFNLDVTVTLSYDAIGFDGDPYALLIYWLHEDGTGGVITDFVVDEDKKTISFQINHFTTSDGHTNLNYSLTLLQHH